ncbi:MAG: hypothetical protein ACLUWN_02255 [Clostridia bacterium]
MKEEYISMNAYMKKYGLGYKTVKNMIENKELEAIKTEGGQYKIKISNDMVSKSVFEEEHKKRIEAETTIGILQKILLERSEK